MYRLLQTPLTPLRHFQTVPFRFQPNSSKFEVRTPACFLNKQPDFCKACIRLQSTITKSNPKKTTRKRAKSNKTYYDLLFVTDSKTKQQRASIKKLTWADLKLLASTNLNLSELHKLKNYAFSNQHVVEHTYNNLTIIDLNLPSEEKTKEPKKNRTVTITTIPAKNAPEPPKITLPETTEEPNDLLDAIPLINSLQPEIHDVDTEEHPEESLIEVRESPREKVATENKARQAIAVKSLASYLEVCSTLKTPQRGLNTLLFHNARASKSDKQFFPIKNIKVYNALLKGFAARGDTAHLEEVLQLARKEGVALNVQSYVAIFECYGRANGNVKEHYLKNIRIYGKEAVANRISFNRILNEGAFLNDEREVVLRTLQLCVPGFVPEYFAPVVQYANHLVDHLNDGAQLVEPRGAKAAKGGLFGAEELRGKVRKQLDLETHGTVTIRSIEDRKNVTDDTRRYRATLADHFKYWEGEALQAFNRDLNTLTAQRSPLNYEPYMRSIPARDFVAIIVEEGRKLAEGSETYSPTVSLLYRELGNKVYARYKVLRKQKTGVLQKVMQIHCSYCDAYAAQHVEMGGVPQAKQKLNTRQQWQWMEHRLKGEGATLAMDHRAWSPSVLQTVGKFLYRIVMHDLKVDVNAMRPNSKHKNYLPAFYTLFRTQGRIVKEEVKPHPVLSRLYRASMPETLSFPAYELPMVCPPVPWTAIDNGGYLVAPCEVVRLPPQATSQRARLAHAPAQQLYPSLDALNQLGAVPWMVNHSVLDVILAVFNGGGSSKLDVPEAPSSLVQPTAILADMDKAEKFRLFKQKLQYRRKRAEMYSLWCDCLYRLSLANHFRDEIFWLPHNMDFRGRVYPIPPHLNHLGSDLARSMLVFAESRPLGPSGLDWLKVHLINLTGLKKKDSIVERLRYANGIMGDIVDSAERPLTGKQWWAESEEPWQTLACCMEIAKASKCSDVENFRSHFPVHQDGSCNGLQHYAALGRDRAGAFSVNLCPSETPQDVYSAVVALVEEQRTKDAANGIEVAKLLEGFVKRKVIKQTIMTTVYGVTRFGARLQIARQLKDMDNFPKDAVWSASSYLTGRTFDSLRSMFTSTREIQDWFTDCARLISAVGGQHVEWITPMGLPIVQPYFRFKSLGTSQVYKPFHMDQYEKPNVMKQKNAFPPNFIHSLDSSHMMLTSLHCEREGVAFVSVHDCYWTHPSTVHIMNQICREQFVALHSEPILENLSVFLTEKYSYDIDDLADDGSASDLTKKKLNKVLRQLPKTGNFDIKEVLKSVYFFS